MKNKEKKELHSKTIQELKQLLKQIKEELFNLKLDHSRKKLKNVRSLFLKRKDIARILSILKEKETK